MIGAMTFDKAVQYLDEYLQKKSTHNTHSILVEMQSICNGNWSTNKEDQQDFANICSNFDKYVRAMGKTSIGRKQFESGWEVEFRINSEEPKLQEDPLPKFGIDDAVEKIANYTETVDNSKDAHSLKVENTRLRNENTQLKAELKDANDKLEALRRLLNPWA